MFGGEVKDLAAQLPQEIGFYLRNDGQGERFGLDEFFERVSQREGVDLSVAIHHARTVLDVMSEAVSQGEMADVRSQLPAEYDALFEADSEGAMARSR